VLGDEAGRGLGDDRRREDLLSALALRLDGDIPLRQSGRPGSGREAEGPRGVRRTDGVGDGQGEVRRLPAKHRH
jgi:hypothetical protein